MLRTTDNVKVIIETGFSTTSRCAPPAKSPCRPRLLVKDQHQIRPRRNLHQHRPVREDRGNSAGVKASGGIRDAETAKAMIEAGASRIGTSSGVIIVGG